MKILHISTPSTWRGGESQLAYLVKALGAHPVEQWVASPRGSVLSTFCLREQIPLIPLRSREKVGVRMVWDLIHAIHAVAPDVIHIHDAHAHTFALAAQILARSRIPMVVSRRVCYSIKNQFFSRWKYAHPLTRQIVCVSEAIAKGIIEQGVVDARRLSVVHDGVPLHVSYDPFARDALCREFHVNKEAMLVANISALSADKDVSTTIDVAKRIRALRSDVVFFVFGEGEERAALQAQIDEAHLREHVFLAGFRANARALLPAFDVLMLCSRSEGLGSSLLDAMVAGVPVVASNTGGIPEIVLHEETGLLAPVGDVDVLTAHVLCLLDDEPFRNGIIARASEHVSAFDVEHMASNMLAQYQVCANR